MYTTSVECTVSIVQEDQPVVIEKRAFQAGNNCIEESHNTSRMTGKLCVIQWHGLLPLVWTFAS